MNQLKLIGNLPISKRFFNNKNKKLLFQNRDIPNTFVNNKVKEKNKNLAQKIKEKNSKKIFLIGFLFSFLSVCLYSLIKKKRKENQKKVLNLEKKIQNQEKKIKNLEEEISGMSFSLQKLAQTLLNHKKFLNKNKQKLKGLIEEFDQLNFEIKYEPWTIGSLLKILPNQNNRKNNEEIKNLLPLTNLNSDFEKALEKINASFFSKIEAFFLFENGFYRKIQNKIKKFQFFFKEMVKDIENELGVVETVPSPFNFADLY